MMDDIRNKEMLIACFLQLLCTAVVVHGNLVIGPRNKAVIAGEPMKMECRVNFTGSEVYLWNLRKPTETNLVQIIRKKGSRIALNENFDFDADKQGSLNIFTKTTDPTDAGIYSCHTYPEQDKFTAHLIVFDEEPLCGFKHIPPDHLTFAMGDQISITCRANFSGFWTPSVEWRQHTLTTTYADKGKILTSKVITIASSSSITSTIDLIIDFDEPAYFSFKIIFLRYSDLATVTATNLPQLPFEWKSPEVIVVNPEMETITARIPVDLEDADATGTTVVKETTITPVPKILEVLVEKSTTATKETEHWTADLASVGFLTFVSLAVIAFAGFVFYRYYIFKRRVKIGLDPCKSPTNARAFPALERPPSGDYDVIPATILNIYDRIDDRDVTEKVIDAEIHHHHHQQKQHPPLTQCYSHLSDETKTQFSSYDNLTPYLSMKVTHKAYEDDPQVRDQETWKSPYINEPITGRHGTGKIDYLALVGDGEDLASQTVLASDGSASDISDYVPPDSAENDSVPANGDYLMPFL